MLARVTLAPPTPEGELVLARCRRILAEMEDAENELGRSRDRPRGKLRVHAGVGFGTHQLVPALPRCHRPQRWGCVGKRGTDPALCAYAVCEDRPLPAWIEVKPTAEQCSAPRWNRLACPVKGQRNTRPEVIADDSPYRSSDAVASPAPARKRA